MARAWSLWQRQLLAAGRYEAALGASPDPPPPAGMNASASWYRPEMRRAKLLQLDVANGEPLTVCVGHRDGCGLVFADSASTRGRYPFRFTCDGCQSSRRRQDRADSVSRAMALDFSVDQLGVHGWCTSCGEWFDAEDVRRRTCDRCHDAHR
jgi:hypothetical protein